MDTTFWLGNLAAVLTSLSFLPQAIQVIKTKDTKSISLPMYLMFVIGIALWLVYGLLKNDLPLILANIITLIFSSIILFYKIKE
ncbi:MAG: SemiSWEET transporter [Saprospiraceae bacterium]